MPSLPFLLGLSCCLNFFLFSGLLGRPNTSIISSIGTVTRVSRFFLAPWKFLSKKASSQACLIFCSSIASRFGKTILTLFSSSLYCMPCSPALLILSNSLQPRGLGATIYSISPRSNFVMLSACGISSGFCHSSKCSKISLTWPNMALRFSSVFPSVFHSSGLPAGVIAKSIEKRNISANTSSSSLALGFPSKWSLFCVFSAQRCISSIKRAPVIFSSRPSS